MKKLFILILLLPFISNSQEYVDLLRVGYGQSFNNDFDGTANSTEIKSLELDLTIPFVLSEDHVLVTGAAFSRNNLQLFPEAEFTSLLSTTLKIGLASTYSEKWSSTIIFLPKLASDYENISGDDYYFGGVAVLKLKKRENLIYRFGIYGTSEAFGFFTTPIIGWYYLSPNSKFEMDMSLPIIADMNYCLGATTIGFDYSGIGRSFNITEDGAPPVYVDMSSLEFASYVQFNVLNKSVLLRAKLGYASSDFEVYQQGEKIDLGVSAFEFGDNRMQLNPDIGGGLFLKFEAIYRFHTNRKAKKEDDDK